MQGNLEVDVIPDQDITKIRNLEEDVITKLELVVVGNLDINVILDQEKATMVELLVM